MYWRMVFFFQAEDGIRDDLLTGVQTCALPILTSEQLAHTARADTLNSRLMLYRDTWRMAAAKLWFGWGLESYAHVFRIFNTQRAAELWVWIPFYAEAHNDWLQSLAEAGFVGTGLLALLVLVPLLSVPWRRVASVLPRYLLAGCALVLQIARQDRCDAAPGEIGRAHV